VTIEGNVERILEQIRAASNFEEKHAAAKDIGLLAGAEAEDGTSEAFVPLMDSVKSQITALVYSKAAEERLIALLVLEHLLEASLVHHAIAAKGRSYVLTLFSFLTLCGKTIEVTTHPNPALPPPSTTHASARPGIRRKTCIPRARRHLTSARRLVWWVWLRRR